MRSISSSQRMPTCGSWCLAISSSTCVGELSLLDGIRAPAGSCVTTDAFRHFLEEVPSINYRIDRLSRLKPGHQEAIGAKRRAPSDARRRRYSHHPDFRAGLRRREAPPRDTSDGADSSAARGQSTTSLPLLESSGSVHDARLKQQGRRFPLLILEMLTSTRRLRVLGFLVAFTHRTHSHRAIGVIACQSSWISRGALDRAFRRSDGTLGSGHSLLGSISTVALSPAPAPAPSCSFASTLIQ